MRASLLLLSLFLSTQCFAEFQSFMSFLSSPNGVDIEVPYCPPPEDYSNYFETDELKEGMKKVNCADNPADRWFYARIHQEHCANRFGDTAFTCVEQDTPKIQARMNNQELMKKITSYTVSTFNSYKEIFANECCAQKVHCMERFQAIKLEILPDTKLRAEYQSDTIPRNSSRNTVSITTAKLASAYNTENIDRVIFAELGHACQFALLSEDPEKYKQFTYPNTRCDKESGLLMFKEGLGDELANCLIEEVESQISELPADQKSKFCFGKWYREVFSDMRFRGHYSSIYHWTYDMGRRSQHTDYSSAFKSLKCAMPKDWKDQLCKK